MDNQQLKTSFHECMPLFIALGDEIRLTIIESLAEAAISCKSDDFSPDCLRHSGLNVREITEKTNLSRPAVSHHIKLLKDVGIINMRRKGTCNYYYLTISECTARLMNLGNQLGRLYNPG